MLSTYSDGFSTIYLSHATCLLVENDHLKKSYHWGSDSSMLDPAE